MRLVRAFWGIIKEVARHILRRPVVGILAAARTADGRWLLIRRGDTGNWAFPGGTLEWGETLRDAVTRELAEEAGVVEVALKGLRGVYSAPSRDFRFHAVTVIVDAEIGEPKKPPLNSLEVREVRLFTTEELPRELSHGMTDMLANVVRGDITWE